MCFSEISGNFFYPIRAVRENADDLSTQVLVATWALNYLIWIFIDDFSGALWGFTRVILVLTNVLRRD
jgi:hypothetical protein